MTATSYSVNFWGSHPDAENDDCWFGKDFASKAEALACYNAKCDDSDVAYIEIDGPDMYEVRKNPTFRDPRESRELHDAMWANEMKWEHRMLYGTDD
jgi:hypothetical protein